MEQARLLAAVATEPAIWLVVPTVVLLRWRRVVPQLGWAVFPPFLFRSFLGSAVHSWKGHCGRHSQGGAAPPWVIHKSQAFTESGFLRGHR